MRGYIVYDSKEPLAGRVVQIANMGELSEEMIEGFLAALRELPRDVAGALENERVVTVRGERVALVEGVVDEDRQVELGSEQEGGVEGGILVAARRHAHPVEHEFTATRGQVAARSPVEMYG